MKAEHCEIKIEPPPQTQNSTTSRTVVFCRETMWDCFLRISTNCIAREFAKAGWRVAWIVDPVCPLDFRPTSDERLKAKVQLVRSGGRWHGENVFEFCPMTIARAGTFWPLRTQYVIHNSFHLAIPSVRRILRSHGFWPVDLLVIGSRSAISAMTAIPAGRVIYYAHDFFADRTSSRELPPQIEAELSRRTDLVLPVQELHRQKIIEYFDVPGEKVMTLPHASNPEMFAGEHAEAADLAGIPRPRVAMLGTTVTMDLDLFVALARRRSDLSFVQIGPENEMWLRRIAAEGLDNVHFLGPKSYEQLPTYLKHCDVGLAIYSVADVGTRIVGGFYMKIYDYAAADLPIVVTEMPGYEDVRDFMFLADDVEGFSAALDRALAYTPEQFEKLRKFACESGSWRARYEQILKRLY